MEYDHNQRQKPMGATQLHHRDELRTIQALTDQLENYKLIFDNIYNGVMVTSTNLTASFWASTLKLRLESIARTSSKIPVCTSWQKPARPKSTKAIGSRGRIWWYRGYPSGKMARL